MRESEAREGKPCLHNYTCGVADNSCGLRKAATAETLPEHRVCSKAWLQTYRCIRRERMSTKIDFFSRFGQYLGIITLAKDGIPMAGISFLKLATRPRAGLSG